jgi:hypothetical protein
MPASGVVSIFLSLWTNWGDSLDDGVEPRGSKVVKPSFFRDSTWLVHGGFRGWLSVNRHKLSPRAVGCGHSRRWNGIGWKNTWGRLVKVYFAVGDLGRLGSFHHLFHARCARGGRRMPESQREDWVAFRCRWLWQREFMCWKCWSGAAREASESRIP